MTQKIKPRHPEKEKNPINPIKKKPEWIRSRLNNEYPCHYILVLSS